MELITLQEDDKELFGLICTRRDMELLNAFNICISSYKHTDSEWLRSEYEKEIHELFDSLNKVEYLHRPHLKYKNEPIRATQLEVWGTE